MTVVRYTTVSDHAGRMSAAMVGSGAVPARPNEKRHNASEVR